MHTGFAELVNKVEATGVARRAQTDLQRKLGEIMKQPNNSERVARDLALMTEKINTLETEVSRLGV
jgi:coiled-coil domain-containing protein 22